MKNLKKALLSTAVLAGLSVGNAFAGTEACFEVYSTADGVAPTAFATLYTPASCIKEADRTGAAAADLAITDSVKVAYELTKSLTLDFDLADGLAGTDDLHIVYIPTTDIPGGTKITMKLTGATFAGNSNQIHLLKDAGDATNVSAVASSDNTVDGQSTITFITKAGITIGAGTRLVLSRLSSGTYAAGIDPVGVKLENTACTDSSSTTKVTIQATEAKTDGGTGYVIAGGTSAAQEIVDASAQFVTFVGSATVNGQVNAESKNFDSAAITARTEFVYDTAANAGLTLRKEALVHKAGFVDRVDLLDYAITRDADDDLELSFVESADAGASVKAEVYNSRSALGALTAAFDLNGSATGTSLDFVSVKPATAQIALTANDVFTAVATGVETTPAAYAGAQYNELFFTVSQSDLTKIMNFNYEVTTHAKLNLDNANELDHCDVAKVTHKVGVNGAVLKVPYTVNGTGNFVRVTNEHTVAAEVTVDLFSESTDGTTGKRAVTAVKLANVPAKSSIVYYVPDVVQAAVDQMGYEGSADVTANGAALRHTMTFTVTSPKNTVHGVSVQKLSTGSDRVMPVLDQNDWAQ
jgi:hypothetical protein